MYARVYCVRVFVCVLTSVQVPQPDTHTDAHVCACVFPITKRMFTSVQPTHNAPHPSIADNRPIPDALLHNGVEFKKTSQREPVVSHFLRGENDRALCCVDALSVTLTHRVPR